MITKYFSFGWGHVHQFGDITLDKDIILQITHPDPRAEMFRLFEDKWCWEYDELPDMSYFPRGVYEYPIKSAS